jgi:hypothetical protein
MGILRKRRWWWSDFEARAQNMVILKITMFLNRPSTSRFVGIVTKL